MSDTNSLIDTIILHERNADHFESKGEMQRAQNERDRAEELRRELNK